MDTSSVCRPFGNSSSSAPTSANVVDVSSSHACGIAAKSSDHDGIATTADRNYNYGKRHFPGLYSVLVAMQYQTILINYDLYHSQVH